MRRRPNQRTTTLRARQKHRWVVSMVGAALLMSYVTYEFFFDSMGVVKYLDMKQTQGRLADDIAEMEAENTRLRQQISAVKQDPATLEGLARDRLGLVREGETVFLIPPNKAVRP